MTKDHDFKRLVRERSAETGKTYMQARDELRSASRAESPPPPQQVRPRLVLVGTSHVSVHRKTGLPAGDNQLSRLGIDLSRTRPARELYLADDTVYIDVEGRIDVDLTDDFDLVVDAEGRITVVGITGTVDAATTGGHITLEGVIINPIADTGDGRINITGAEGTCRASTDNGHITIRGGLTFASADTGDGHITIDSLECGDIHTGGGHVELTVAGRGADVAVHADTAIGGPAFIGQRGDWSTVVGNDHSRLLTISASGRVTLHDRTT